MTTASPCQSIVGSMLLSVVGCRLSVVGCQLSVVGCRLSASVSRGRSLTQRVHQFVEQTADFACLRQQQLLFFILAVLKLRSKDNVSLQFMERAPGNREKVQEGAASVATVSFGHG